MSNGIFPIFQSIKDTVKVTGLSEFYLRKLLKSGNLPHTMSGNKVLVNVPLLVEQIEKGELGNVGTQSD